METVYVWLAPSDQDQAIHYWYQLQGDSGPPHRLCDGALGLEQWPDSSDQQGDTCLPCREVYLTDLRYGHRALRFIEEPPSQEERDTKQRKLRNYHTAKQPAVFVTRGPKSVIETGEISAAEL